MWLTQKKIASLSVFVVLLMLVSYNAFCKDYKKNVIDKSEDRDVRFLLSSAKKFFNDRAYKQAINKYRAVLEHKPEDSIHVFRELALLYAKEKEPEQASEFIEKYVHSSLDIGFVGHSDFDQIGSAAPYVKLKEQYLKKIDWWSIFCFYVAFIGVFISIVLNLRKRSNKTANLLMSAFVLIHSFFIIHLGLYFMNYEYYLPHILYMSTGFSFLYGPLIYFYFKRVALNYHFRIIDIWHLVPTVLLVVLLFPIYNLPEEEKLRIVVHEERPYLTLISITKLISLLVYGTLVIRMYLKSIKKNGYFSKIVFVWQRNIVIFCSVYIIAYTIYSILIIQHIFSGFLFYFQIVAMALLVLYVSYTAFVQPSIFGNLKSFRSKYSEVYDKYKKSGLTKSLSLELKGKLLYLLNEERIYRQNDITLQKLAESLETTRHNASQIINEHFDLNFFELINKYRIEEAKELLKGERDKNFTIIDVAYEVGFNNKVTFNKSFKKYNQITPSEYIKSLVA